MPETRLSTLDASFLTVESPSAHMHVGWASLFRSPPEKPSFEDLRGHIASRMARAPRYRQKLAQVPFGVNDPVWIDDEDFDICRHVRHTDSRDFGEIVDRVMSSQLDRDWPLWELWIADDLADGRLGVIGKAHHCMVDGIAAVELASLLLDTTPEPPHPDPDGWRPARAPDEATLLAGGIVDRVGEAIDLTLAPVRLLARPQRLLGAATGALRTARASVTSLRSATPETGLNEPISAARHLARSRRPMADFKRVKRQFGTTINDVVLTVAAGGVRRFLERRGETPVKLKAMVPVSVRPEDGAGALGNQISFVFVDLPCDEPDPLRRLTDIKQDIGERKRGGEPQGADALLKAFGYAPRTVQHVVSQAIASPRTFNLVVSNIPGLPQRMYMLGCELEEVYPVVPIADRHALSIGFTTFNGEAFFGVYADSESLPDADRLAEFLDESMDELLALG